MNTVLYSFMFYMRNPSFHWMSHGMTTSVTPHWDSAITLFGANVEEAQKTMPEEFADWEVVKVDYPIGWPHYPMFPPSTCTSGAVGINSITGEHYLR